MLRNKQKQLSMKDMVHWFSSSVVLALAILASTGCQSVYTSGIHYVGEPHFAPSDPAQVLILRTEPTREHIRLGEVRVEPSSLNVDITKIEEALRKEAAKLGADAVIVVYDQTQVTGTMVTGTWGIQSMVPIQGRVVVAIAIKYR
jgi:hypothetical protein